MDPQSAWSNLTNAIEAARWAEAAEIAEELLNWIGKGRFLPTITGKLLTDKLIIQSLCETVSAGGHQCSAK